MQDLFERVYTVTDYYDGPREGIADFRGVPHFYHSLSMDGAEWNPEDDRFALSPVAPDVVELALENYEIDLRWAVSHASGAATDSQEDEERVLPQDRNRRQVLSEILGSRLMIDPSNVVLATGRFRVRNEEEQPPPGVIRPLEVCWSSPS